MQEQDFQRQLADLNQMFISRMDKILKEPPQWFPRILWYKLASLFLNI